MIKCTIGRRQWNKKSKRTHAWSVIIEDNIDSLNNEKCYEMKVASRKIEKSRNSSIKVKEEWTRLKNYLRDAKK